MSPLTDQEYRIARSIANRMSRNAIEGKLGITENTLRVHLGSICKKWELASVNPHRFTHLLKSYTHRKMARPSKPLSLAPAEREVINFRIAGKTFRQIAEIRGCALPTVLCLSSTACRKLGIRKSTNPATLAAALAVFDARSQQPLAPADALSLNPNDY